MHRILVALGLLIAVLVLALMIVWGVLTRPFAEPAPLMAAPLAESVYGDPGLQANGDDALPVLSPFHLRVDPMEALLLFNFEQDPDEVYVGFEPQSFDDEEHGHGLLVIGWRADGQVDVFHDPDLVVDPRMYGIAGGGLHALVARPLTADGASLAIGPEGASADFTFTDLRDRTVRLRVHESDPGVRTRFGLLAPMGSAATTPPALPLVYVDGFTFVRRRGTELAVEIDGRVHRTDPIPLVLDGRRTHFVRYSAEPLVAFWNHNLDAVVRPLAPERDTSTGALVATADGVRYDLETRGRHHEIRRMRRAVDHREVMVDFVPPFPDLRAVAEGARAEGVFRITAMPSVGTVDGRWHVVRESDTVRIGLFPEGGWTPGPAPRMARLLFRMIPVFRQWPTTYAWNAAITLPVDGSPPVMNASWERIEAP